MSVVQSEGALVAIDRPWAWPLNNRFGQVTQYNQRPADYAAMYQSQPALRTVVDFLARNIAQLDLHTFRKMSQAGPVRLEDHPLAVMLDNPSHTLTTFTFIRDLVSYFGVYDAYYAIKVGDGGGILGLLPVPPWRMDVIGGNPFFPSGFVLNGTNGKRVLKAEEVFYLHGFHPLDPRIGLSPIETLRRLLDEEEAVGDYREGYWKNAARMSVLLTRPVEAGDWAPEDRERFRADWQQAYSGSPGSGSTAILEDGMTAKEVTFSAVDSQYLESRKLTREEVASAYHIAPTLVGILDHATFSNITEQHKNLYQDTLGPWLRFIEQEIQLQLLPEFADRAGVSVRFNIEEKLRGSFEEQSVALQRAIGRPWMVPDEGRAYRGLVPLGGNAAELATPVNLAYGDTPVDAALLDGTAPKSAELEARVGAFLERQKRAVLSRLGAKGQQAAFDTDRWARELTDDLMPLVGTNGEAHT